jgi:hypothetical protein
MKADLTAKQGSQTAIADRNVTMANHVMRASHGLTLPEKRMIAARLRTSDFGRSGCRRLNTPRRSQLRQTLHTSSYSRPQTVCCQN